MGPKDARPRSAVGRERLVFIDLARTAAILTVLSVHLSGFLVTRPSSSPLLHRAWERFHFNGGAGVMVFFVVSGFVITRILDLGPSGLFRPDIGGFYARRIGRLVPLMVLACVLGALVVLFVPITTYPWAYCFHFPSQAPFSPLLWISIATFWSNWYQILAGHRSWAYGLHWDIYWTLAIEEQFYLFYPLALRRLKNETRLFYFLAAVMVLSYTAHAFFAIAHPDSEGVGRDSFWGFCLISMGCLLYLIHKKYGSFLRANGVWSWMALGSGAILFGYSYFRPFSPTDCQWILLLPLSTGLGVFFLLLGGLHLDLWNSPKWTPLTLPGKLSYGEYLLHPLFFCFFIPIYRGMDEILAYGLMVTLLTLVAWICYRSFEVPANLWTRKVLGW